MYTNNALYLSISTLTGDGEAWKADSGGTEETVIVFQVNEAIYFIDKNDICALVTLVRC
jgi:hypothetical protein